MEKENTKFDCRHGLFFPGTNQFSWECTEGMVHRGLMMYEEWCTGEWCMEGRCMRWTVHEVDSVQGVFTPAMVSLVSHKYAPTQFNTGGHLFLLQMYKQLQPKNIG